MNTRIYVGLGLCALLAWAVTARAEDKTVDLSKSTAIDLPSAGDSPVAFKTPDGKQGWVRRMSTETIPTPAYAKGRLYTGAGFSSRQFFALDATTGKTLWQQQTQDNGPTSPVVSGNYVTYNTESCHSEVRETEGGNLVWSEVTGGTLLTQPVIADGCVIIPHPMMARKANTDIPFRMLAADLKTGKHAFDAPMTGDVLSAPAAADGRVAFTCTDGRVFCLSTHDGAQAWHAQLNAAAAPLLVGQTLVVSTVKGTADKSVISMQRYRVWDGEPMDAEPLAATTVASPWLDKSMRADWDFQGPRVAYANKRLFNAPGNTVNSVAFDTGKTLWRATLTGNDLNNQANMLTPPALGQKKVFLASARGHLVALNQEDGSLAYSYKISQPVASQPVLAGGSIYFGTSSGMLVCLKVDDPDADQWHAWGGNAQHNKTE